MNTVEVVYEEYCSPDWGEQPYTESVRRFNSWAKAQEFLRRLEDDEIISVSCPLEEEIIPF